MKILLVRANPRKTGFTQKITDLFLKGLRSGGADVTDVDLMDKEIKQCTGCFHCWTATPGTCIFKDDMDELLEMILDHDMLLCSTPLYHYTLSAKLLTFMERTLPLFFPGFGKTNDGLYRNVARFPERWQNKKLGYIAVGGLRSTKNFSGLQETFHRMAEGMDMELVAEVIRPESFLLPYDVAHPMTIKGIENAVESAGRELATTGRVSEEIRDKAAAKISQHEENFEIHSKIFWEYVDETQERGLDQNKVQNMVIRDVRVLMHEIVTYIDPNATKRIRAGIQFVFTDVDRSYHIQVDKGTCELTEGELPKWDLKITTEQEVWSSMFLREIGPMECLTSGKIKLEGDKSLFSRFEKMFPPPRV